MDGFAPNLAIDKGVTDVITCDDFWRMILQPAGGRKLPFPIDKDSRR